MTTIEVYGQSRVDSVKEKVRSEIGVNIDILTEDGAEAPNDSTISDIRTKSPESADLKVSGRAQVSTVEEYFEENYGIIIEIKGPDGSEAEDSETLASIRRRYERMDEALPPLASWINDQMAEQDLDPQDLSEEAGISTATVKNLITGKTENPTTSTVDKVEKALGESIPEETAEDMRQDAEVAGIGQMQSFDPHGDDLPEGPGVYVFYDITERPVYVGKSITDVRARIRSHKEKFWFRSPVVETGEYIGSDDDDMIKSVETLLIKFMKSNAVLNKKEVER
jgi:DNA-binding Xre family transcriptional regulator